MRFHHSISLSMKNSSTFFLKVLTKNSIFHQAVLCDLRLSTSLNCYESHCLKRTLCISPLNPLRRIAANQNENKSEQRHSSVVENACNQVSDRSNFLIDSAYSQDSHLNHVFSRAPYEWILEELQILSRRKVSQSTGKLIRPTLADNSQWIEMGNKICKYSNVLPPRLAILIMRQYAKVEFRDSRVFFTLLTHHASALLRRPLKEKLYILDSLTRLSISNFPFIQLLLDVIIMEIKEFAQQINNTNALKDNETLRTMFPKAISIVFLSINSCIRLEENLLSRAAGKNQLPSLASFTDAIKLIFYSAFSLYDLSNLALTVSQLARVRAINNEDLKKLYDYIQNVPVEELKYFNSLRLLMKTCKLYLENTVSNYAAVHKYDELDSFYEDKKRFLNRKAQQNRVIQPLIVLLAQQSLSHIQIYREKIASSLLIDFFGSFSRILSLIPSLQTERQVCNTLLTECIAISMHVASHLNPQSLAILLSIFSQRQSMRYRPYVVQLAPLLLNKMPAFQNQHISMIFNSLATVNLRDSRLLDAFEHLFEDAPATREWSAQSISNILRSVSKLDFYSPPLLKTMIHTYLPSSLDKMTLHGLINSCFSLTVFDKAFEASQTKNLWNRLLLQILQSKEPFEQEGLFQMKLVSYLLFGPSTNGLIVFSVQPSMVTYPLNMEKSVYLYLIKLWKTPVLVASPKPSSLHHEIVMTMKCAKIPFLSEVLAGPYIIDLVVLC